MLAGSGNLWVNRLNSPLPYIPIAAGVPVFFSLRIFEKSYYLSSIYKTNSPFKRAVSATKILICVAYRNTAETKPLQYCNTFA
ncbi:hypothetical protein NH00_25835 [Enterobacter cancerogenus]|nr:hypothetical protein NH00_25835 [Enterobacter cancerogenus]